MGPRVQRRDRAVSGTVVVRPSRNQRTTAVPIFGSTDSTRPISPVAFLRTCPGGSGVASFWRSAELLPRRRSRGTATLLTPASRPPRSVSASFGTTVAPVPFAKCSSLYVFLPTVSSLSNRCSAGLHAKLLGDDGSLVDRRLPLRRGSLRAHRARARRRVLPLHALPAAHG